VRRRHRQEAAAHSERWLISYADFITLLFAFFVTLYAISTVDVKKAQKAQTGFHDAFADWREKPAGVQSELQPVFPPPRRPAGDSLLANLQFRLLEQLKQIGAGRVKLSMDQRGLVVSVQESDSFPTGRAELDPKAKALFRDIGLPLADVPNAVRVEGHTDDLPIHTARYASNWELSTARATNVVAYFVQELGIAPERLSAAGYAEFHPRAANDSIEHRAANRRVDIVVLNTRTQSQEEPRERAGAQR
jgi:chemotaxis protein MotB